MTDAAPRFPANAINPEQDETSASPAISLLDETAFIVASERLTRALDNAAAGRRHDDIAQARQRLREIAVKLRDAGYWRTDKIGLRATVSLLWQADRYVSESVLRQNNADKTSSSR